MTLGIMQGRLLPRDGERYQSFPWQRWRDEFQFAKQDGFDFIEFIYEESEGQTHPLMTDDGVAEIRRLIETSGVAVRTVCADEFMFRPLHAADAAEAWALLDSLIRQASKVGAEYLTVPCLDDSSIPDAAAMQRLARRLAARGPLLDRFDVTIGLETDLPPAELRALLDEIDHPRIGVTYDIGNCAALGQEPGEVLGTYGDRIEVVHVKDRPRDAASVPLGTGDADFPFVVRGLAALNYRGPMVLQAARSQAHGRDREVARAQAEYFEGCLQAWST